MASALKGARVWGFGQQLVSWRTEIPVTHLEKPFCDLLLADEEQEAFTRQSQTVNVIKEKMTDDEYY